MATHWWVSGPSAMRIMADDIVRIEFDRKAQTARVTRTNGNTVTLGGAESLARLRQLITSTDWMTVKPAEGSQGSYDSAHLRLDFADSLVISLGIDRRYKLVASRGGETVGWTTDQPEVMRVARLLGMQMQR